ncbi:Hpt domain-containing protein [Auraticoccus monumenti]|uniref:Hpt domain-containing protein n=1 Tax=Auraticoccus monumenti TaxID=675864 RepID=A0A1G6RVY1_9ACTN|nr:Hpt domain-containing protein [Auraticoccus monumenti]SDD08820.1 hypothetical protein SAMN04489747_0136 [Auraticoccus monumenti]
MSESGDNPSAAAGSRPDTIGAPLLNDAVLDDLVTLFDGDCSVARGFVDGFVTLSSARLARIRSAVARHDGQDGEVALLSLKTTSSMIGADRLTRECDAMAAAVRAGDWERLSEQLNGLHGQIEQTNEQLRQWLGSAHAD